MCVILLSEVILKGEIIVVGLRYIQCIFLFRRTVHTLTEPISSQILVCCCHHPFDNEFHCLHVASLHLYR